MPKIVMPYKALINSCTPKVWWYKSRQMYLLGMAYKYLPKMAFFLSQNGSAWHCFRFWVAKLNYHCCSSLLGFPSSGIKNNSPESQYSGQKKLILFYYLMRLMRIDAGICGNRWASANIRTWPSLVPYIYSMIVHL